MAKKYTREEFIEKAKEIHGNKYDYSKVKYINNRTKVCIICPIHGEFWQRPDNHINLQQGCSECVGTTKMNTQRFIERACAIHGEKYIYSKVEYKNANTKVCIICPTHGEFWQTPASHLSGKGCKECAKITSSLKQQMNLDEFVKRAREIHGDKYDYSKSKYNGANKKICIICPIHGEFWQKPSKHIHRKHGCPECAVNKRAESRICTTEIFIKKAKEVHNSFYDYSKVNYVDSQTKVCIICPKHGEFWQKPNNHLQGKGCLVCNTSKLEKNVQDIIFEKKIVFNKEAKMEWLGQQRLDFYLPDYNIAIECQGIQHFKPTDFAGKGEEWAEELFKINIQRDQRKKQLCKENGIELIYFLEKQYVKYMKEDDTYFTDIDELLKYIKSKE